MRMMTDKIIMGLIFLLVILIVAAVIIYSIWGKKETVTGMFLFSHVLQDDFILFYQHEFE